MDEIQDLIEKFGLNGKKIAFCDIFDPIPVNSGGDWYRYQLLSDLSEKNEVVEYFTKQIKDKEGYYPQNVNFKRQFLDCGRNWNKFWNILSPKIEMIKPDLLFNKSPINNIQADIIFTIVECYHIAKYISKINNNAPIILVMHNVEWKYLKNIESSFYIPMKYYENHVLSKVDAVISISAIGAEYAFNYTNNNVYHVPPKTDPIFTPEGDKYNYGGDKLNLLFYGSLNREQNIYALNFIKNELIPLMKEEKIMDKVRVNIFGSGNPPKFLDLENDNDINFLGTVEDPSKYVRGADLVLVPLKNSAGIKIRIIETLGCLKPIIATPEAVKNLQDNLKDKIYIKNDVKGFIDIIKTSITHEFDNREVFELIHVKEKFENSILFESVPIEESTVNSK